MSWMRAISRPFDSASWSRSFAAWHSGRGALQVRGRTNSELYLPDRKLAELREACHADHGYTAASTAVQRLYQLLSSYYDREHQRVHVLRHGVHQSSRWRFARCSLEAARFHAYAGLKALKPRLTVVFKGGYGDDPDAELPSVMTCQN